MPNKMLENIRKNMAENSGGATARMEELKGATSNNAQLWSIAENSQTVCTTLKD